MSQHDLTQVQYYKMIKILIRSHEKGIIYKSGTHGCLPVAKYISKKTVSLSTLVLNSRDRHEKYACMASSKKASTKQPDNNVFLQNTAIKSISTMLLGP